MTLPSSNPLIQRPLRVGLIGCGTMGLQHLQAISAIPGAVVVGVADPQAKVEDLKALLPAETRIFAGADELLSELKPDVVHIVTPPSTHGRLTQQALESGCHVYVEKPFTPSRAEAEAALAIAAERGLKVCAGHQYLFERPAILSRDALRTIGRLVHVESYFSFRMVRRTISPVEQLQDILPHAVYPLVEQLRAGSGCAHDTIELKGVDVRADGDLYALLKLGECTGILLVTLSGRPIEQYQHLIGTNGSLRADYVTGSLTRLTGPGTGPGILFTPYRRAYQTVTGATSGFAKLIFGRTSYPGLQALIGQFYSAIRSGGPSPITPDSIVDTVSVCETLGRALADAEARAAVMASKRLQDLEASLPIVRPERGLVLVTGGTGLLGRRVAAELRQAGFSVRVLARRIPRPASRLPGVEYIAGDLAQRVDLSALAGVRTIVHCAAETSGGREDHLRNSIGATRHVMEAAALGDVADVIHISSLAVLKPSHQVGGPLDEASPIDAENPERGPYVWGKAASELLALKLAAELGVRLQIIRPGPLVDYDAFSPPGRLGRELGPWFVAIGGRRSALSVCDVGTAARVIRSYLEDPGSAPPLLNLVEAPAPTRGELANRLGRDRPDLRFIWFPSVLLRLLSGPLKIAQRLVLKSSNPVDVYAAFASERYRTNLAAAVIERAGPTPQSPVENHAPQTV